MELSLQPFYLGQLARHQFDRRLGKDRRMSPTPALSKYALFGRRKAGGRRECDQQQIYVDRYDYKLLLLICGILILCIADAYFTIFGVSCLQVRELNPIMAYFLNRNFLWFFVVKYVLTSLGLIFLCLRIKFKLTRPVLGSIFLLYLFVLCSHLYIFSSLSLL